jgi:antitoxin (DNA-binding transcriptional repressor) of toxin-antitoxin stability system
MSLNEILEGVDRLVNHLTLRRVKTISIRDLRSRWSAIEKALGLEHELVITRDGHPVAKLVRVAPQQLKRKRWEAGLHKKWLDRVWRQRKVSLVAKYKTGSR